ncbi:MAG: hypothetical protein HYT79_06060 [Elusimicrobia bacterium]|nr:hypothetical protein [Elusimicrobiota bacterium]
MPIKLRRYFYLILTLDLFVLSGVAFAGECPFIRGESTPAVRRAAADAFFEYMRTNEPEVFAEQDPDFERILRRDIEAGTENVYLSINEDGRWALIDGPEDTGQPCPASWEEAERINRGEASRESAPEERPGARDGERGRDDRAREAGREENPPSDQEAPSLAGDESGHAAHALAAGGKDNPAVAGSRAPIGDLNAAKRKAPVNQEDLGTTFDSSGKKSALNAPEKPALDESQVFARSYFSYFDGLLKTNPKKMPLSSADGKLFAKLRKDPKSQAVFEAAVAACLEDIVSKAPLEEEERKNLSQFSLDDFPEIARAGLSCALQRIRDKKAVAALANASGTRLLLPNPIPDEQQAAGEREDPDSQTRDPAASAKKILRQKLEIAMMAAIAEVESPLRQEMKKRFFQKVHEDIVGQRALTGANLLMILPQDEWGLSVDFAGLYRLLGNKDELGRRRDFSIWFNRTNPALALLMELEGMLAKEQDINSRQTAYQEWLARAMNLKSSLSVFLPDSELDAVVSLEPLQARRRKFRQWLYKSYRPDDELLTVHDLSTAPKGWPAKIRDWIEKNHPEAVLLVELAAANSEKNPEKRLSRTRDWLKKADREIVRMLKKESETGQTHAGSQWDEQRKIRQQAIKLYGQARAGSQQFYRDWLTSRMAPIGTEIDAHELSPEFLKQHAQWLRVRSGQIQSLKIDKVNDKLGIRNKLAGFDELFTSYDGSIVEKKGRSDATGSRSYRFLFIKRKLAVAEKSDQSGKTVQKGEWDKRGRPVDIWEEGPAYHAHIAVKRDEYGMPIEEQRDVYSKDKKTLISRQYSNYVKKKGKLIQYKDDDQIVQWFDPETGEPRKFYQVLSDGKAIRPLLVDERLTIYHKGHLIYKDENTLVNGEGPESMIIDLTYLVGLSDQNVFYFEKVFEWAREMRRMTGWSDDETKAMGYWLFYRLKDSAISQARLHYDFKTRSLILTYFTHDSWIQQMAFFEKPRAQWKKGSGCTVALVTRAAINLKTGASLDPMGRLKMDDFCPDATVAFVRPDQWRSVAGRMQITGQIAHTIKEGEDFNMQHHQILGNGRLSLLEEKKIGGWERTLYSEKDFLPAMGGLPVIKQMGEGAHYVGSSVYNGIVGRLHGFVNLFSDSENYVTAQYARLYQSPMDRSENKKCFENLVAGFPSKGLCSSAASWSAEDAKIVKKFVIEIIYQNCVEQMEKPSENRPQVWTRENLGDAYGDYVEKPCRASAERSSFQERLNALAGLFTATDMMEKGKGAAKLLGVFDAIGQEAADMLVFELAGPAAGAFRGAGSAPKAAQAAARIAGTPGKIQTFVVQPTQFASKALGVYMHYGGRAVFAEATAYGVVESVKAIEDGDWAKAIYHTLSAGLNIAGDRAFVKGVEVGLRGAKEWMKKEPRKKSDFIDEKTEEIIFLEIPEASRQKFIKVAKDFGINVELTKKQLSEGKGRAILRVDPGAEGTAHLKRQLQEAGIKITDKWPDVWFDEEKAQSKDSPKKVPIDQISDAELAEHGFKRDADGDIMPTRPDAKQPEHWDTSGTYGPGTLGAARMPDTPGLLPERLERAAPEYQNFAEGLEARGYHERDTPGFLGYMPEGFEMPQQGVKFHVSASPEHAVEIGRLVTDHLRSKGVAHKLATSESFLQMFDDCGTQCGKFITVYPRSFAEAAQLMESIDRLLVDDGLVNTEKNLTPADIPVGRSDYITMRWGRLAVSRGPALDWNGHPLIVDGKRIGEAHVLYDDIGRTLFDKNGKPVLDNRADPHANLKYAPKEVQEWVRSNDSTNRFREPAGIQEANKKILEASEEARHEPETLGQQRPKPNLRNSSPAYRKRLKENSIPRVELSGIIDAEGGSTAVLLRGKMGVGGTPPEVAVKMFITGDDAPLLKELPMAYAMEAALPKGMAPKIFGEVDADGNPAYAMEIVKGVLPVWMSLEQANRLITPETIRQASEGLLALRRAGIGGLDAQFFVLTEPQTINGVARNAGDVVFIDAGGLTKLQPGQKPPPNWLRADGAKSVLESTKKHGGEGWLDEIASRTTKNERIKSAQNIISVDTNLMIRYQYWVRGGRKGSFDSKIVDIFENPKIKVHVGAQVIDEKFFKGTQTDISWEFWRDKVNEGKFLRSIKRYADRFDQIAELTQLFEDTNLSDGDAALLAEAIVLKSKVHTMDRRMVDSLRQALKNKKIETFLKRYQLPDAVEEFIVIYPSLP